KPAVLGQAVSFLDWYPTFTRLAGVRSEAAWKLEGRDVWPLLSGEGNKPPAPTLYWNTGAATSVIDCDWKLIVSKRKPDAAELFNLSDDPQEKKDLAGANPKKVEELRKVLAEQKKLDP